MLTPLLSILAPVAGILATIEVMKKRELLRKEFQKNKHLDILPNDTRRAFWSSAATDDSGGDSDVGDE